MPLEPSLLIPICVDLRGLQATEIHQWYSDAIFQGLADEQRLYRCAVARQRDACAEVHRRRTRSPREPCISLFWTLIFFLQFS